MRRRSAAILSAVAVLGAAAALASMTFLPRGLPSMSCKPLSPDRIDEVRRDLLALPLRPAAAEPTGKVRFRFSFDGADLGETVFVVYSRRMRQAVYRGPYRADLSLPVDAELSADGFYDILDYSLLSVDRAMLCKFMQQVGDPYWRPGADARVTFLKERTTDRHGLMRAFEVEIR